MAKIPLTMDPKYCEHMGFFEALREILQNAKDAEEYDNAKMTIEHMPRSNRLIVSSEGVVLTAALLLLLGATSKRGTGQRGKFGEGFALACLVFTRMNHVVTIYNGDEVWRPVIEQPDEGHPFAGSDLLVFNTRKLREPRTEFSVEIENVSKEVWDAAKKLFLFLTPPLSGDVVDVHGGRVLLGAEHKGKIFSRGIFVCNVADVECGYDVNELKLDRDRQVVEEWDLRWRLSELLNSAHRQDPEKFRKKIYTMVKEDCSDVKSLRYHADTNLLKALREEFEEEHGTQAVPVQSTAESKELEAMGATTVVVNATLRELLEKTGPKAADVKEKLRGSIKTRYAWGDLQQCEKDMCTFAVDPIAKSYSIVDFNDENILCQVITEDDGTTLAIAKKALYITRRELAMAIVVQEAQRRGVPEREVCADAWLK